MHNVAEQRHIEDSRRFRQLWSKFSKAKDLIQLEPMFPDTISSWIRRLRIHPDMVRLLQQDMHTPAHLGDSVDQLGHIVHQ